MFASELVLANKTLKVLYFLFYCPRRDSFLVVSWYTIVHHVVVKYLPVVLCGFSLDYVSLQ